MTNQTADSGDVESIDSGEDELRAPERSDRYTLEFQWRDGRESTIAATPEKTILEAAERSGVGLPYGCRTGACGSCVARLLKGAVRENKPQRALKPRFHEAGYVLTCVTSPTTDCSLEVGPRILDDLLENPWK